MVKTVDAFLSQGCGRCSFWKTPSCKVRRWTDELNLLRRIMRSSPLEECSKWGVPCYMHNGKNLVLIHVLKEGCGLSFVNGILLSDPNNLLKKPGTNSHIARVLRFTSLNEIEHHKSDIQAFIQEAMEVELCKKQIPKRPNEVFCSELESILETDPVFQKAFFSLTPGRQRGYNIFFSSAKSPKTRIRRIHKYYETILSGKGRHDN